MSRPNALESSGIITNKEIKTQKEINMNEKDTIGQNAQLLARCEKAPHLAIPGKARDSEAVHKHNRNAVIRSL